MPSPPLPPPPPPPQLHPPPAPWARILCVDWSKHHHGRAVWHADVATRAVAPLAIAPTVASLLAYASKQPARTLIGIDAALGIPTAYLASARAAVPAWSGVASFVDWLAASASTAQGSLAATHASEWTHERPFIAVPAGKGSLSAFWQKAGGELRRDIDRATGGSSPFVVSGIPGSVGSGSRALWGELAALLVAERAFGLWPFDTAEALAAHRVVLGEVYPRACYALALSASLPTPARSIGKTKRESREAAIDELLRAPWLGDQDVAIDAPGLTRARADENHFDAMISAAALLRCLLENRSLDSPSTDGVEGGILGVSAIVPRLPRKARGSRGSRR